MILECGKCAKMYRVRDDAGTQPTQCPTCGGSLAAAGGGTAPNAAARVKELETRIQNLEKELEETRTARPTLSAESMGGFTSNLTSTPVAELRSAAENSARLERELMALRSESERKLKEKERELAELREGADRESAERRRHETKISGLEETHARAIEGKDKTIAALDASIASYRSKVESLQKKLDAVEIQRLNDLNAFDHRLREREQSDRAALDRTTEAQQRALADLRAEMEAKIEEKDRLISEGRQALDREAAERRRLTETLNRLQENANRDVAEKSTANQALEATLATYKSKVETLQKRVDSLEQLRRTEHDQITRHFSSRQSIRGRVDEAGHLATDFDQSLDSMEATLATLRERARRLKEALQDADTEPETAPPISSLAASSLASDPEPEAETAPPALSQTDSWDSLTSAPAAEPAPEPQAATPVEPEPEPEMDLVPEPAPAPAAWSAPTADPYVEPLPEAIEAEPSPEPSLLDTEPVGRLDEPSGIIPVQAPPAPAAATPESSDDLPLISGPEESKGPDEPPKRKKFSWQRK